MPTSSDGKCTALVDSSHPGVLLRSDLVAPRYNWVRNVGAEVTSPLSLEANANATVTRDTSTASGWPSLGVASYRVTAVATAAASARMPSADRPTVWPGQVWSCRVDIRSSAARTIDLRLRAYNATGGTVSDSAVTSAAYTAGQIRTGQVVNGFVIPAGAVSVGIVVNGQSLAAAEFFQVDKLLLERAATAGTYFDGGMGTGYRFLGASQASVSYLPGDGETAVFARSDGKVVRSGNGVPAPNGIATAYDFDPPLGVPVTYTVNGSAGVTVTVPLGANDAWLKSHRDPSASVKVTVRDFIETYPADLSVDEVLSTPYPAGVDRGEKSLRGDLTLLVKGEAAYTALRDLMRQVGPWLLQASPAHGIPGDIWFLRGQQSWGRPGQMPGWYSRELTIPIVQVARPSTVGWPAMIPAWSAADTAVTWASVNAMVAAKATVWDVLLTGIS